MPLTNRRKTVETELGWFKKNKHKVFFDQSPVPMLEQDFSAFFSILRKYRAKYKNKKYTTKREQEQHKIAFVKECIHIIKTVDANQAAVNMFGVKDKKTLIKSYGKILESIPAEVVFNGFLALSEKQYFFDAEFKMKGAEGKAMHVLMRLCVPTMMQKTLGRVIVTFQDISHIKRLHERLRLEAQIDGLTKLWNQKTIIERLEEEMSRAKRYRQSFTCIIADLDSFKKVNDTLGHLEGDKLLVKVAKYLKDCLRKTDIVGRYGGDEFLIILTETPAANAGIPVNRILNATPIWNIRRLKQANIKVTFSIGVCGFPAAGIETAKNLIGRADEAAYKAKKSGGNQFVTAAIPTT